MMWLVLLGLILGIGLLIIGYRKNDRNIMLIAALLILVVSGIEGFSAGFFDGLLGTVR